MIAWTLAYADPHLERRWRLKYAADQAALDAALSLTTLLWPGAVACTVGAAAVAYHCAACIVVHFRGRHIAWQQQPQGRNPVEALRPPPPPAALAALHRRRFTGSRRSGLADRLAGLGPALLAAVAPDSFHVASPAHAAGPGSTAPAPAHRQARGAVLSVHAAAHGLHTCFVCTLLPQLCPPLLHPTDCLLCSCALCTPIRRGGWRRFAAPSCRAGPADLEGEWQ